MAQAPKTPKTPKNDTAAQEGATLAAEVIGAQNEDGSAKEAVTPAVAQPASLAAAAPAAFVPKIAKILTLPLLKMKEGEPIYIKFTAPTFVGKKIQEDIDAEKAGKVSKAPPIMANVINLPTGEMVQIMLGKVLVGILGDEYPDNGYVGRGFMIQLTEKKRGRAGGDYNTYKVVELDLS